VAKNLAGEKHQKMVTSWVLNADKKDTASIADIQKAATVNTV
jgi:hypothetical protein